MVFCSVCPCVIVSDRDNEIEFKMKLGDRRSEKQQEQAFQQSLLQQQNVFFAQQQHQMMEFM